MPYEGWKRTAFAVPPRSRLYRLEPEGVGTQGVESLTSYISRLAEAHCVSPNSLMTYECYPVLDKAYLNRNGKMAAQAAINGMGSIARDWVRALEALTLRNGLRFTTALTWRNVLAIRPLTRAIRAWCPLCLERWRTHGQVIYDPLLWALESVTICPHDLCQLKSVCPHCKGASQRLSWSFRPGYCSTCRQWLPSDEDLQGTESFDLVNPERAYEIWKAKHIGKLLAAAPTLSAPTSREKISESLSQCIERVAEGQIALFCGLVEIPNDYILKWRTGKRLPTLKLLLKMCFRLAISPLDFFMGQIPNDVGNKTRLISDDSHTPLDRKGRRERLRQVLLSALNEEVPGSLSEIARDAGYASGASVSHSHRELYDAIMAKRQALARNEIKFGSCKKLHTDDTIRFALERAIKLPRPVPLTEVARGLGYKTAQAIRLRFPELCAELVRTKKEKFRAAVTSTLEDESITTAMELARRLGHNADFSTLRIQLPDVCRTVSARRRQALICRDVQVRLILQATLTEERPPSLQEMSRRLKVAAATLMRISPQICKQIIIRFREYQCKQIARKKALLRESIRDAVLNLGSRGVYPSTKHVTILLKLHPQQARAISSICHKVRAELGFE